MDIIMLLFLGWLFGGKGGGGKPPNFPPPSPVPQAPAPPGVPAPGPAPVPAPATLATYTLRSGDTGYALAQRGTGDGGRWKEILGANPNIKTVQDRDPDTGAIVRTTLKPWNPGQVINVPAGWSLS